MLTDGQYGTDEPVEPGDTHGAPWIAEIRLLLKKENENEEKGQLRIIVTIPVNHARSLRADAATALEQLARLYRSDAAIPLQDTVLSDDKSVVVGIYTVDFAGGRRP